MFLDVDKTLESSSLSGNKYLVFYTQLGFKNKMQNTAFAHACSSTFCQHLEANQKSAPIVYRSVFIQ